MGLFRPPLPHCLSAVLRRPPRILLPPPAPSSAPPRLFPCIMFPAPRPRIARILFVAMRRSGRPRPGSCPVFWTSARAVTRTSRAVSSSSECPSRRRATGTAAGQAPGSWGPP